MRAAAFPGAAEELDVTMLEAGPQLALAERAAAELVAKARQTLFGIVDFSFGSGFAYICTPLQTYNIEVCTTSTDISLILDETLRLHT